MTHLVRIRFPVMVRCLSCAAAFAAEAPAPTPTLTGFPFTNESLRYIVNWPSGLTLGEAIMTAARSKAANGTEHWDFKLALDASVPGFGVSDSYRAASSTELCAMAFEKELAHGSRKTHEFVDFDSHALVARRHTPGGGQSEVSTSSCARDALTFLYYTRRELGQGRIPPNEDVVFGAQYQVQMQYKGAQSVKAGRQSTEADCVQVLLKGPASETMFEMFFARDAARTPLLVRVPLALGTFSLELAR